MNCNFGLPLKSFQPIPRMRVNQHQSYWSCAARWRWRSWDSWELICWFRWWTRGFSTWMPWWYMGCHDVPGMPGDWFKLQDVGLRLVADLLSILLGCDVFFYWICDDLYLLFWNIAVATCIQVLPHWFILEDKTVWADLAWWQGGSSVCSGYSGYKKYANLNLLHYATSGDLDDATVWDTLPWKMIYSIYSVYWYRLSCAGRGGSSRAGGRAFRHLGGVIERIQRQL